MTPVILLTGFLGSGKTTLLSRLLTSDDFRDTAVIVNEFGAVSLDHDMVRSADETIVTLGNGCLCCLTSSDIGATLADLRHRRGTGEIAFRRVIIETSGLADPVPLLHALGTDGLAAMDFVLSGVITVVDAMAGAQTLDGFEEARRQVAMADVLLVSKLDLAGDATDLHALLASLNPSATIMNAGDWQGAAVGDVIDATERRPVPRISAIRTAISDDARGKGVLVVLNDEIHTARDATKTSTYRLQTFQSRDFGLLGHVDGDQVVFYRAPLRKHTLHSPFDIADIQSLPRVDIVYSYGGADGTAVDAFVAAGTKGIISAGFAPGIPAPLERRALEHAAAAGIVVVQSSRAGSGRVARRKYLRDQGMLGADNLNPQKARVLLSLALTKTGNPDEIQALFETL